MKDEKIIGALVGLAGACSNNQKTSNTDMIIINALSFAEQNPNCDDVAVLNEVEKIHEEKNLISPNCAVCKNPCANTCDFDMNQIYEDEAEIKELKLMILSRLKDAALILIKYHDIKVPDLFYTSLLRLRYDLPNHRLLETLDELEKFIKKQGDKIE